MLGVTNKKSSMQAEHEADPRKSHDPCKACIKEAGERMASMQAEHEADPCIALTTQTHCLKLTTVKSLQ